MATNLMIDGRPVGRTNARPLTDLTVRNLKANDSRTDGALPVGSGRLVVSCTKARGQLRRVWTFRYRSADLRGQLTIGEYPALSLDQARNEARALADLVRQGVDPKVTRLQARQANVAASRASAAIGDFRSLLEAYVAHLRRSGKVSAREVENLFNRHVLEPWRDLAKLPANAIEPEDIRDILAQLVRRGIKRQTNVLRSYLQAAFANGAHSDLDPRRAASSDALFKLTRNPVALVPRIGEFEATRDRILSDEELAHLWNGLQRIRLEIAHAIRCATLLGGQRFRQLLRATWKDYDQVTKVLRLSDTKGKRSEAMPHLLPVPPRVQRLIAELHDLNGKGEYIFSTTAGKKAIHATGLPQVFRGLAAKSGLSAGTQLAPPQGRDIRRSVETRLQSLGVSREIRSQLLSHGRTSGVQQKHYERHTYLAEKAHALAVLDRHIHQVVDDACRTGAGTTAKPSTNGLS